MKAQNEERFERLRALAPIEAVQAWLDGDFGVDDEPAMISAIRKDPRIHFQTTRLLMQFAMGWMRAWILRPVWSVWLGERTGCKTYSRWPRESMTRYSFRVIY